MPNGPEFSENEWSRWRGEVTSLLREGQAWMARHESEEFAYHDRVHQHIVETKEFIATTAQHRGDLAARVVKLETTSTDALRDVEQLKTRMNIMFTTLLPIAAWAIFQLIEHLKS
jgi:hypothetical protein